MSDEQVAWLAAAIVCARDGDHVFEDDVIQPLAAKFYAALTGHWLEAKERYVPAKEER